MNNTFTPQTVRSFRRAERGLGLPEVLVALLVLASVTALVASLIMVFGRVTRTAQAQAMTESQLLDGVTRITRDVAFASPILTVPAAGTNPVSPAPNAAELWTQVTRGTDCLQTRYWTTVQAGTTVLLSYTWITAAPAGRETIPCAGVDAPVWADESGTVVATGLTTGSVFTYYGTDGSELTDPAGNASSIGRVQVSLTAQAEGRSKPLSLVSSAALHTTTPTGGTAGQPIPAPVPVPVPGPVAPGAPVLSGVTWNADDDGRVNDNALSWLPPRSGIPDEYIIYRGTDATGVPLTSVPGTVTQFDDRDRPWGSTTDYVVLATNRGGASAPSNSVTLTVRPGPPVITGTATDDALNHLTWPSVPTATCYNVFRDGRRLPNGQTTSTTFTDPAGWGTSHTYAVTACNQIGESILSNTVALVQRPQPFDIVTGSAQPWAKYTDKTGALIINQGAGAQVSWTGAAGTAWYDLNVNGQHTNVGLATSSPPQPQVAPGSTVAFQVTAVAPNGLTRTSSVKTVLVPPTPPANVHSSTWCNPVVNTNGWKYGMDIYGQSAPVGVPFDRIHIQETQYHTSSINPDGSYNGFDSYRISRDLYLNPFAGWGTYAWGDINNNGVLIANSRGSGGGMLVSGEKFGWADYGSGVSVELGVSGAIKQGNGPVLCNRQPGQGWGYNGNAAVYAEWNWTN